MAERGGVPVRRLAVGVRSHLAAAIADRAHTVIQSTCGAYVLSTRTSGGARASLVMSAVVCFASRSGADCNGGLETNFQRARAHQIRYAHQLIWSWRVTQCKLSMPIHCCLLCSCVGKYDFCPGLTADYSGSCNCLCRTYRVAGVVSPGMQLTFDSSWERGRQLPPFLVDNKSAVDFLLAVVESPVGTGKMHSITVVTEAVAVQVYKLLTNPELDKSNARASIRTAMLAVYVALASLHYN